MMRPATLFACVLAALAGGSLGPGVAQSAGLRPVEGALTYRARMALPPGALAVVEARDDGGALVAAARVAPKGREVPLPFALALPDGAAATLHAAIFVGARAEWASGAVEIPAGEEALALGELVLERHDQPGLSARLRCGEHDVTFDFTGTRAIMDLAEGQQVLESAPAASGARYTAPDRPDTVLHMKGANGVLHLEGVIEPECRPAPPRGEARFRAVGHEPIWHLDMADGRVELVTDFGATSREAPLPRPAPDDDALRYDLAAWGADLRVARSICRDIATGMPHPYEVRLTLPDRALTGCGGAPRDLLVGPLWQVSQIEGQPVEAPAPTLAFGPEGRLSGRDGCNRYMAGYALTGEGLGVSPAATTSMACPEPQMETGRRFRAAIGQAARFDIAEDGALLLLSAAGDPLVRARPD